MKKIFLPFLLSVVLLTACQSADDQFYSDAIAKDSFKLKSSTADTAIKSPAVISGEARGSVFFEGTFPVSIEDSNGLELGIGQATSTSNWMTADFIPFTVTVTFNTPTTTTGFIVLKNDNPSGLPANAHSAKFSISF